MTSPASRAAWTRTPLVAVLAAVAVVELALNRVLVHFLDIGPLHWRAFAHARLFAYELTAVLAVLLFGAALVRAVYFDSRYRLGARISLGIIGTSVAVLAATGAVANLPGDWAFHLQLSFTFFALILALALLVTPAPLRLRLGVLVLFWPVALHCLARLLRRLSPSPELSPLPLEVEQLAQATLAAAAVIAVPCFAARGRAAARAGLTAAALVVSAMAIVVRNDWETSARVAAYAFGLSLPVAPWALVVYLLALGGFTHTTVSLLCSPGAARLRGYGLLLIGIGGLGLSAPHQVTLAALGFFCLAESILRQLEAPLPRADFEQLVRHGAAQVGAPQVVITGSDGYETVRLHSPPAAPRPLALTLSRHAGVVRALDVVIGEVPPRDPPFTLARRDGPRLGPHADSPDISSGDAAFDARFTLHDRRGPSAPLFDDELRARALELIDGWVGVWPHAGVRYRARSLGRGDEALARLIALLEELAVRTS